MSPSLKSPPIMQQKIPITRRQLQSPQIQIMLVFLLFLLTLANGNNPGVLVGEPMFCPYEGAPVTVPPVLISNSCLTCFCKNHNVQCRPSNCPSVEGCYRLQKTSNPECCQTCLGCIDGDKEVPHGNVWQDKCRIHQCQAGVLTSSNVMCHVPCSNPQPPENGDCCPTCKGCWLEGRELPEGRVSSPRLDPCVRCSCSDGELKCTKRSCPVLSCPPYKAVLDADGCCLVCNGSREIMVLPGGRCFLGRGRFYKSGDNSTVDQCTTCSCKMGYLTCERETCPPLQCPERYRQSKPEECCPTCVYPTRTQVCLNNGVLRDHGDVWNLNRCTTCTCTHGRVTCEVEYCDYLNKECPVGFRKEKLAEDCCPKCVEEEGVCVTYGDPHYKTFDNYLFNFQGECRYELAKDCFGKKFSVRVNNDARRSSCFSWTRSLSLKIVVGVDKFKISLGQRLRTKVNRQRVKLPYKKKGIKISRKGFLITVATPIGVEVCWDGASYVEVKVDPSWRNQTCGLCGNFNRLMDDDKRTKKGEIAFSDEDMANSWQSGKTKSCSRRHRQRQKQEMEADTRVRTQRLTCVNSPDESTLRCKALNHTVFDACRRKVSIDSYYSSCILDLCECPSTRMCECDSVIAFVRECERARIDVQGWRAATKCGGFDCPYGSEYMDCAPACRPSCKNQTPNPDCHMRRCKAGCYCPPPTVLHRGACILPEKCPKKRRPRRRRS